MFASHPTRLPITISLLALAASGFAQQGAVDPRGNPWLEGLSRGALTVWVPVSCGAPQLAIAGQQVAAGTTLKYAEQTSGSFGQSASTYGTASSNVGASTTTATIATPPSGTGYKEQTSGSFGQSAGSTGTSASNHGQAAASFGTSASNTGTAASNAGQDAGTYGHSLSTIAGAGENPLPQASLPYFATELQTKLHEVFPELRLRVVGVACSELRQRLIGARGLGDAPDLLLGPPSSGWSYDMESQFGVATAQTVGYLNDGVTPPFRAPPDILLLRDAPHREVARALLLWLSEPGCAGCVFRAAEEGRADAEVAEFAREETRLFLLRRDLGVMADPAMAHFPPQLILAKAATARYASYDPSTSRIEVENVGVNGQLAVVSLRVLAVSDTVFGVTHPLMVLRRGAGGWLVLHISLDLSPEQQTQEFNALLHTVPPGPEAQHPPRGIGKTLPVDGDQRSPQPELSWDNLGGAGLQVVEWQTQWDMGRPARPDNPWLDPHLFLVPDLGEHMQTRVRAAFAHYAARFRWRVWSVGAGGAMAISPWHTFAVTP